jgi:hypothetical protein
MLMSTYYRAQAQRCLALSRACSDRTQGAQLAFMANRYFERAEELEREVRFQPTAVVHREDARTG